MRAHLRSQLRAGVLAGAVVVSLAGTAAQAATLKTPAAYKALHRAQAMRALGYAERAGASPSCPAMHGAVAALRRDLLQFYGVPAVAAARDAATIAATRAGAAEAAADLRKPRRYCDGLEEVLAVWRSYTLSPDTEEP